MNSHSWQEEGAHYRKQDCSGKWQGWCGEGESEGRCRQEPSLWFPWEGTVQQGKQVQLV